MYFSAKSWKSIIMLTWLVNLNQRLSLLRPFEMITKTRIGDNCLL